MDAQFWINAWKEGRTNFHRHAFHEKLLEHFPSLKPEKGQKVLVPLCGKTKDLLWLHSLGLNVHGIELYEEAVKAFFDENNLSPVNETNDQNFKNYSFENICISCGDFFKLHETKTYDLIYDRASLVALPFDMRKDYAKVLTKALRPGGKYLLIVYEYDQSKMDGPPFSVTEEEIRSLYGKNFDIQLVDTLAADTTGSRFSALGTLKENVYILTANV